MNTNDTYQFFNSVLNQGNAAGKYSPSQVFLFINRAQYELFSFYLGFPEIYQQGRPLAPQGIATSKRVDLALRPFYKPYVMPLTNGVGTIPEDYIIFDNARNILFFNPAECGEDPTIITKPIKQVRNYEVANILSSPVDYPTVEYPIFEFGQGLYQILVYPKTLKRIQFNYFRAPLPFYWGHDPAARYPVWIPADPLDQPLEWSELDQNKIIARALTYASIGIREEEAYQMVQDFRKSGI